ncbi:MAG: penicillin-binding protein 2 [Campylobacterota bacterium]|nr:penicillin-binding protein 2 [Campylobacterota bacterium]
MRSRIIIGVFIIVWLGLLVRIFYLSIKSNDYYEALSNKNTIKNEMIAPVRGEILDRNKMPIAINKLGFRIKLRPHLSGKKNRPLLEEEINVIVGKLPFLDRDKLLKNYLKQDSYYNHHFIEIVDFISYEDIMPVYSILTLRESLKVVPAPKRYYPNRKTAAHVIGYVSKANKKESDSDPIVNLVGTVGKSGVEKYYNQFLQGTPGERKIKVTAHNEEIRELGIVKPIENSKLLLTIDMRLQTLMSELFKGKAGAAIVMDTDGAILAAGSYPEYDINAFVSGISTKKWNSLINNLDVPFTNKIINGLYPPGSTIKTGLGLVYITSGISQWWKVYCSGSMKLGNRNFRCWKTKGHKETDVNKAIRESCDDYFYKGSLKVGIATMSEGLRGMGLGKKTGIDLSNEFIGTVPSRIWKRQRHNQPWYRGETLNTSIGQGDFLVTPLQMAQFTALMATGKLPKPHLAMALNDEPYLSEKEDVLTKEQKAKLPIIQRAMREVCNHPKGTATQYLSSKVRIAGKTGTAQVVGILQETKDRIKEHEMAYYTRSHAWFSTYGPMNHPKYIVTVMVEHGGHGGEAAGGIVSKIYNKLYELGYIKRRK